MHKVSISPITRANAVGAVTVMVDQGRVVEAYNEGTIFRGFELIMEGRDPLDAPYLTQRICGICSSAHGLAACLALEGIAGVKPPRNGILTRNLILGLDFLQNHIRHFYLLGLWDWVTPPDQHPFRGGHSRDLRLSQAETGKLQEHYWLGVEHARLAHETLALIGGKAPHNHGLIPGGASFMPVAEVKGELLLRIGKLKSFIEEVYLPDAFFLQEKYPDYRKIGRHSHHYLGFGLFPRGGAKGEYHFPPAAMLAGRKGGLNLDEIAEDHASAWYRGKGGSPFAEISQPDPSRQEAYSWIKAPRYGGFACEGGPLAREMLETNNGTGENSVMARILARSREAALIAGLLQRWVEGLVPGEAGCLPFKLPAAGSGAGITDAMRGPLGHWIKIKGGRISQYQIITPSAWNFSPRDRWERTGPVEEALLDTPVADLEEPVEIGRVIRSFDPCYACSAHVLDLGKGVRQTIRLL